MCQGRGGARIQEDLRATLGVIPAKAGIHRAWVPAYAGTTAFVTFISVGGPQAHVHSA
jgi:hypothetical protein